MRIAVLGATSQIAMDLITSISGRGDMNLHLFARRPNDVKKWLGDVGILGLYPVDGYADFGAQDFDAIINFVGAGNPAQISAMGASIFDVTFQYDELALDYLRKRPECRYIFLSSGAAYGSNFERPVDSSSKAEVAINSFGPRDWYALAKLYAECRHRSLSDYSIVDVRVFNYFSHTQDITARFLITDILRSIQNNSVLTTSSDVITRDFIHPSDFYQMITGILFSAPANAVVDCYSLSPVDKSSILDAMEKNFGLRYEVIASSAGVNATGGKPHYYSLNRIAKNFGYQPQLTSLDGILIEANKFLALKN